MGDEHSHGKLQTWSVHIIRLLEEPEIGVLLGAAALLLGLVSRSYHGESVGTVRTIRRAHLIPLIHTLLLAAHSSG